MEELSDKMLKACLVIASGLMLSVLLALTCGITYMLISTIHEVVTH